jgi:MFS family permease
MLSAALRKYRASYAGLPREAWMLSAILFINTSGTMVVFFLTLYLTRHLGFSVVRSGQVLSGYGFGMLLGNLLGGWASDRLGPRATQKLSLALSGVLLISLGFFTAFPAVLILMSLYGLSAAALFPANASALAEICAPEIRSRGFVLSRLANNLGATIGPVVGGFLAGRHYGMLFWIDGATCLLAALAFFILLPRPSGAKGESPAASARFRPSRFGWMKDGGLLAIIGLSAGLSAVFIQMFGVFPLYMKAAYGLAERMIGPLFAVNTVLIVLTQMPLTHAVESFRRGRTAAAGMVFLGAGLGMLPLGRTMLHAAAAMAVLTVGEMLLMPTLVTMISLRAPEGGQGQYQGLFGLAWGIGSIVGPSVGTRIYDTAGGAAVWVCAAGLSALVALGFLALDRAQGRGAPPGVPAA